jgi:hypothetical protein
MRGFRGVAGVSVLFLSGLVPAMVVGACGDEGAEVAATEGTGGSGVGGSGGSGSGAMGGAGGSTGQYTSGVGGAPTDEAPCGAQLYDCGDLEDNDGDGLIDYQDPDCLGPCDDTEDHYHPNLPGWPGDDCHQDCFWDTGNGSNEDCYWDHHCDPLSVDPNYYPEGQQCENTDPPDNANFVIPGGGPTCEEAFAGQPTTCTDFCVPLTPNGCDCFGCCELPAGSGKTVWIGSYDADDNPTCTLDVVDDPSLCQPCTQVPACDNDCGKCEYCLGKTELPPECFDPENPDDPPDGQCPPELQACGGPNQDPCPAGTYCITGCCVQLPN